MAANQLPVFPFAPVIGQASSIALSTAFTTVSGTGTNTAITAATTEGLRVDAIRVTCSATSAAALVLLFIYDGTNQMYFDSFSIAAVTASTTVAPFSAVKFYSELVLAANYRIFACTTINQNTNCFVHGGSY